MGKDYHELAAQIVEFVGGKENVNYALHCATRLRFNLKEESLVKGDELKGLNGVLGLVKAGGQYQVVIGPDVDKVFDEVCILIDQKESVADKVEKKEIVKKNGQQNEFFQQSWMLYQEAWDR